MAKKFTFKQDGKTYSIPAFSDLPMGVVRKARKATDEADTAFTIIESVMGEDSPELNAVDSMNAEQFQAFIAGWTQGAGAGEALSSAN